MRWQQWRLFIMMQVAEQAVLVKMFQLRPLHGETVTGNLQQNSFG